MINMHCVNQYLRYSLFLAFTFFVSPAVLCSERGFQSDVARYAELTGQYHVKRYSNYLVVSDLLYTDVGKSQQVFSEQYLKSPLDPLMQKLVGLFEESGSLQFFKPLMSAQFMSTVLLEDPEAMRYDASLDVFTLVLNQHGEVQGAVFLVHSFTKPVFGRSLHRLHRVVLDKGAVQSVFESLNEEVIRSLFLN